MHTVQQRFARWLLSAQDCVQQEELALSHETVAQMLAVQRPTVSEAAAALQEAGLIQYRRGRIRVVDCEGLQRRACECYGVVRRHRERAWRSDRDRS